jgi:hypothetical protein
MEDPADTCDVASSLVALGEGALEGPRRRGLAPPRVVAPTPRASARSMRALTPWCASLARDSAPATHASSPADPSAPRAPAVTAAPDRCPRTRSSSSTSGFGDAGKGVVTDHLAQRHRARTVVRFNGGAQAGHNVVTADGRHHTFAQLAAAASSRGAHTHLAAPFVLHPTALLVEAQHLARKGLPDPLARVTVSPEALVITPLPPAAQPAPRARPR